MLVNPVEHLPNGQEGCEFAYQGGANYGMTHSLFLSSQGLAVFLLTITLKMTRSRSPV